MAWQSEVGASAAQATDYHDLLNKLVQFACSQHVATVAINNGGTGGTYAIGDVLTLTHASAHLDARFEVLTVSAGQVLTMRILDSGAFAQQAVSATVSAGGSGYAVGDIIEVAGGSSRCPAKFQVATLSGSAVATVTLFEGGGVYSSTPSNPAATAGVGPTAYAGDDACTLTVTYQALITPLTNVAVTGGGGTGATVDITLAETGWAVDSRNTNDLTYNGVTNEKEVVLVGDASGKTNKPYIGFGTCTETSGINTRYAIALYGMITHNSGVAMTSQVSLRGAPGTFSDGYSYLLCDEDQAQNMDFWFSADDSRLCGVVNINPGAANTDNGEYMHFYHGFMDTFATETEDPYPAYVFAASRLVDADPSSSNSNITGLSENRCGTSLNGPGAFFQADAGAWRPVTNTQNVANQQNDTVVAPCCRLDLISNSTNADKIVSEGPVRYDNGIGSLSRQSPSRRLRPVPGTVDHHLPIPLTVLYRPGGAVLDETNDTPRGQLRGCFWIYNTNSAGATISDFSEDYITIGTAPAGDRYLVFHTHVSVQLYNFICIKESV